MSGISKSIDTCERAKEKKWVAVSYMIHHTKEANRENQTYK